MNDQIVICDQGLVEANSVPAGWLGRPGGCPAGVYETVLWLGRRAVDWAEHRERLADGCRYLGIAAEEWISQAGEEMLTELAEANGLTRVRSRVRIMVFQQEQALATGMRVRFVAAMWPAEKVAATGGFRCGINQITRSAGDASYQHKLLGRAEVDRDLEKAAGMGLSDMIYVSDRGEACEGSYSNLWIVKHGVLFTPRVESPCLPGVTRRKLLKAAAESDIEAISDQPVKLTDVMEADEVFLSSSIRGVQPVSGIVGVWQDRAEVGDRISSVLAKALEPT